MEHNTSASTALRWIIKLLCFKCVDKSQIDAQKSYHGLLTRFNSGFRARELGCYLLGHCRGKQVPHWPCPDPLFLGADLSGA